MDSRWYSASEFYRRTFGCKIYKLSLDAGCTCPTRDGTKGTGGCIFCSPSGSGDFAASGSKSVTAQIQDARRLVDSKLHGKSGTAPGRYIAYFQNFTSTYGDADTLESEYREALAAPDIAGFAVATRPDCLSSDMLRRIAALSEHTFTSIELGLQTVNNTTAAAFHRGYDTAVYDDTVGRIRRAAPHIHIVTHVMFGLPGEAEDDMLNTVRHCAALHTDGIKFTVTYVLRGTPLAKLYSAGSFTCMTEDAYFAVLAQAVQLLPADIVIHRLTGDGPKKLLIAPQWTADKKRVLNSLNRYFAEHDVHQGALSPKAVHGQNSRAFSC